MGYESHACDYSRYFIQNQKVYLVNVSDDRDKKVYESLEGIVSSSRIDEVELRIAYDGHPVHDKEVGKATYKLTSESMGSGIQVMADLVGVLAAGKCVKFRMHGELEMFKNRVASRVDCFTGINQLQGALPLDFFRHEWLRILEFMAGNGLPPGIVLSETEINLSVEGIGLTVYDSIRIPPLSIFFIVVDGGLPVCVLAETVWQMPVLEMFGGVRCGFRFIDILKSDQERIADYVRIQIRKEGGAYVDYKRNWLLVDQMVSDIKRPE